MSNADILVVIDMQNDFIDGSLGTEEARAIVPNVRNKILKYMEEKKPIIFTQDTHLRNYLDETLEGKYLPIEHCIKGTEGWKLSDEVITRSEIIKILYYMNQEIGGEGYFNTDDFIFEKDTFGTLEISSMITMLYFTTEKNPSIEITNHTHPYQGALRFGVLDTQNMIDRCLNDFNSYAEPEWKISFLLTHTNEVRPEKLLFLGHRLYLSDSPTRESILLTGE